ncbi:hypothetical protein DCAR_0728827 [Daucus carota subsp. sativus]|uniref:Ubiquitin-like protease family profile domain-containing protein n=1 Tax=Daucus carota subsp. sativus TaxID=79200 RepID=A0AAF0XKC2_DAUCS|nr:hypothetical protein DCAR_0728827 [Daucus carota subsp. sativus]
MQSSGDSIQIPCDAEVFGIEKRIFILYENIVALLEFNMIGQAAIAAYMQYQGIFIYFFIDYLSYGDINAGRGNKAPSFKYITGCPKQPGGTECGYVIMRYMKEIVMDNEMTFFKRNRKVICSKAELDEVRFETLSHIESFL